MSSAFRFLVAWAVLGTAAALADPPTPPNKPSPPKQDFPPFEESMKDFKEVPSKTGEGCYLTLYRNEKSDEIRAVIPGNLIGRHFLIASSMSGGPFATGFQLDHSLVYFERMDKNLVLMEVDTRYEDAKGQTVADVVSRSYRDNIIKTVPIVTVRGSDPVISMDSLFKADFGGLGEIGGGTINPSLSKWAEYKAFPNNVELTVDAAFMRRGAGQRLPLHFSIAAIPQTADFKPRVADSRVGYFMTVRKDWGKKHSEKTLFDRYVDRWNLQKRDPSLEKSPPVKPITWYVEKTVPVRFRTAVRQGILEWNKAFEKCGFQDAIIVLQQEDNNEYKDLDPEDTRYSFFRWIVTGRGFAMGPHRSNPLTGEIFDADIVFDDAMVRHYVTDYERLTGGPAAFVDDGNPLMQNFFARHPEWAYHSRIERLMPDVQVQQDMDAEFYAKLSQRLADRGQPMCEYAAGMAPQIALAGAAFAASGKGELPDEFLNQIVKEIVMHEVGHCLGLRHNFKASTWLPMEQIANSDGDGSSNIGSVMDYNPPIMPSRGKPQNSYTTRSIGPYDYWAIEYGYRPVGKPYSNEQEMLTAIGKRVAEDGLAYGTDEDTLGVFSPDPLCNRFDCSKDVVEYAKRQIALTSDLLSDVAKWAVKDGESYSRLRRTFTRLAGERSRVCGFVARFVGGQIMNRDYKGDKDERPSIQPVSAERQREAVKFLVDNLFAKGVFNYDTKTLNQLAPGRNWHWDSDDFDMQQEFDVHEFVERMQYGPLFGIMNPFTLNRVYENQIRMPDGEKTYPLAEHMTTVTDALWNELDDAGGRYTDDKPLIDSFRRNLQRRHLEMMLNLVVERPGTTVPADCNAIARLQLSELSEKIGKLAKTGTIDTASLAHLKDVKKQIDRSLDAQFTINQRGGGGFIIFGQPAGQAEQKVDVLPSR